LESETYHLGHFYDPVSNAEVYSYSIAAREELAMTDAEIDQLLARVSALEYLLEIG
jgi:hypothetical protein